MAGGPAPFSQPKYTDPEYQKVHGDLFSNSTIYPLQPTLPPGISQSTFDLAITEWTEIVGRENISAQNEVQEYIDPYELNEDTPLRKVPSAAVCPATLEQAQGVLRIANKYKIPLWTFSRGKNLGFDIPRQSFETLLTLYRSYGGPAPRLSGSVALDLHRMNKIIEVNEHFSYAVVEPGVTFTDLYKYCTSSKLGVWPSVPSLGWGSIIGNTVDRGTGFTPTATHFQNIAGLEILLSDGDIVRTGQFGIQNSASAHLSKFTFGPSIEGLFLQSNLGIVTKLGIWLTPQPDAYMSCSFEMPKFEDIETIVEIFGMLRRNGVIPNTIFVSNVVEVLSLLKKRVDIWDQEGPIPDSILEKVQKELGIGYWNAKFGLFGPRKILQSQVEEVQRIVDAKAPTGKFRFELFSGKDGELLDASSIPEPHGGVFVGVPTLWSLPMIKFRLPKDEQKGIAGHGDFSSIIPSDGKAVLEWVRKSKQICEKHGFDLFCDFFMHERHIIFVNFQPFDKLLPEHRRAVQAIFADLYQLAKTARYSNYRSHVNHMDPIAELYDFNNHAYRRFVEKLKNTLDPNGILSPGKQGIWGQNYEQHRDASSFEACLPVRTKL